jgi:hypothetical protein
MRRLLFLLTLFGLLIASTLGAYRIIEVPPAQASGIMLVQGGVPTLSECATDALGDLLNEGFQTATTGYETSGWLSTNSPYAPDPAADTTALTNGKPANACNQGFRSNSAAHQHRYAYFNLLRETNTTYLKFWFYLNSNSLGGSDDGIIFQVAEGTLDNSDSRILLLRLHGTTLYMDIGTGGGSLGTCTTGIWHQIDMIVGYNTTCSVTFDNGTPVTGTSSGNNLIRNVRLGVQVINEKAIDIYFDKIHAKSSSF